MSALIIGESSAFTYFTYLLIESSWEVTVFNINDLKYLREKWTITINSSKVNFEVDKVITNIDKATERYDLVLMTRKFQSTLLRKIGKFLSLLYPHTIIIVDCTSDPLIFGEISIILSQQVILAFHSDTDCRRIAVDQNKFMFLNTSRPTFNLGLLSESKTNINDILSIEDPVPGQHAYVLARLRSLCDKNQISLNFIKQPRILNKLIWKSVIFLICFHILSIIYEEYDILKLSHLHIAAPVMKGCFVEVTAMCNKIDPKLFPENKAESSHKRLQVMILMESNKYMKLNSSLELNINSMDANPIFYNFVNGYELPVTDMIHSVITLGKKLGLATLYLQSTQSFLLRLLAIRTTDYSKIFHLKKNLSNFETVNGITPEKNMMNFPPFNPLPLPSRPLNFAVPLPVTTSMPFRKTNTVMMVLTDSRADNNLVEDNESTMSVDPELRQMVNEYGGDVGGDAFYDSVQQIAPAAYRPCPPIGTPYPQAPPPNTTYMPVNQPPVPPTASLSSFIPQHSPLPSAQQQYLYPQYQLNNPSSVYAPQYQSPYPLQYRKPSSFYHLQPIITRNTPVEQLLQSHISAIQNLGPLSRIDTSNSPYGKYDTTTTYVNSANNSRASKSSSVSSHKR